MMNSFTRSKSAYHLRGTHVLRIAALASKSGISYRRRFSLGSLKKVICLATTTTTLLLQVPVLAFAVRPAGADDPPKPAYVLKPDTVQVGTKNDVYLSTVPASDLTGTTVLSSNGSGVNILGDPVLMDNNGTLDITIAVDPGAPLGKTRLKVISKDKSQQATVELTVIATQPLPKQPTPGGISEVDVMWQVIPLNVVRDNFGRKIAKEYYCIEIALGNNTGYDLQLAGVGFTVPDLNTRARGYYREHPDDYRYTVPGTSYRLTRGTLERGQVVSPRNVALNLIKSTGPMLTGFLPFFHVLNHRNNYSEGVNIFSNPFEKGFEVIFPDMTIAQLARLDEQTLRDGLIVPNNTQLKTKVFFPKDFLNLPTKCGASDQTDSGQTSTKQSDQNKTNRGFMGFRLGGAQKRDCRNDPETIMIALGQMVIVGDKVQHLERIRVVTSSEGGPVSPPPTVLGITPQSAAQGDQNKEVVVSGSFLDHAVLTGPAGVTFSEVTPDNNGRTIRAKITVADSVAPGPITIIVTSAGGSAALPFTINAAAPTVDGTPSISDFDAKNLPPSVPLDRTKQKAVKISVTGKHLEKATLSPMDQITLANTNNIDGSHVEFVLVVPKDQKSYDLTINNGSGKSLEVKIDSGTKPDAGPPSPPAAKPKA